MISSTDLLIQLHLSAKCSKGFFEGQTNFFIVFSVKSVYKVQSLLNVSVSLVKHALSLVTAL